MPLRYSLAVEILPLLRVSPFWLATGQGERGPFYYLPSCEDLGINQKALFSEVFDAHLARGLTPKYSNPVMQMMVDLQSPDRSSLRESLRDLIADEVVRWMDEIPDESLEAFENEIMKLGRSVLRGFKKDLWERVVQRRRHRRIAMRRKAQWGAKAQEVAAVQIESENKCLHDVSDFGNVSRVNTTMANLLDRLNKVTSQRGMKSELAKRMKVPLSNVSQWLSGDREPGGETTLRMLAWVQVEEAKLNSPPSAETPGERKTRPGNSSYEKPKSNRPKG